ncbi:MarR family winged helix-turn-helix transcriptional regulator [Fodinibius salsisoli]|uniref:MarR family transcriptional regulator n=1 Tax=Fodinibius salsisoli TaxID=2820877 RepID=A0ABT3PRJ5_9BACT|nr:MarR family transcriptional regulator [Fodinibius salsisoli]MCW9708484.1 MarR family transcriptional regulator [Fodinibius salsisoli]
MSTHQKLYCDTLGCKMAYAVKGIMRALNKRFKDEEINLTLEQFFLLNILNNEEGLILQDLADIVDRDKSAVLRHINGLEEKHFVARTKDPEDKRRKILLITKAGFEELKKAKVLDHELDEEISDGIPKEKLEKLDEFLADIYNQTMSDDFC